MWTHNHLTTKQTNKKASKQANKLGNPARSILRGPCPPPYFRSNWGRQGPRKKYMRGWAPFLSLGLDEHGLPTWFEYLNPSLHQNDTKKKPRKTTISDLMSYLAFQYFFWLSRSVIDLMFTGNMIIHGYFLISLTAM